MMQSRNLKLGILVLVIALVAALIFGVGLGQDFTDGYLVRINSANAFDEVTVNKIYEAFGGKLGELRIQYAQDHYNAQLLIHVQKAEQADADKMVEIALEDNEGAYLRGFDTVTNHNGAAAFRKYTFLVRVVYLLGMAYVWYRQGRSGGVAALAGSSAAFLLVIAIQSIAGMYFSEATFMGVSVLTIVFAQMMIYLLNDSADAKAGLLAGEDADTLAKKAWTGGKSKVIVLTAAIAIFALTGCVMAEGVIRNFMTAILMGACSAALMTVLIGLPTYVLFAHKYMLKAGAKKKAKAIK